MALTADAFRKIETHLLQSGEIKRQTAASCAESIAKAAEVIAGAFLSSGKLLLCGNGGSAADCQHMAAEFVSRFSKDLERRALPAIALTTDTSFLTAFGNDYGFEGIFERQVEALGSAGDVLIGISTSGNSPNVIRAIEAARKKKYAHHYSHRKRRPFERDGRYCHRGAEHRYSIYSGSSSGR